MPPDREGFYAPTQSIWSASPHFAGRDNGPSGPEGRGHSSCAGEGQLMAHVKETAPAVAAIEGDPGFPFTTRYPDVAGEGLRTEL
jgi:hypothetical protein